MVTSLITLIITTPVNFDIVLLLTELSPTWLHRPLNTAIELLAAVPFIMYGTWGLLVFAPIFGEYFQKPLTATVGKIPVVGALFQGIPIGIGLLCAGVILTIVVIPYISAVMRDVFEAAPTLLKESAYGMDYTTWEVMWNIVLPYTEAGVIGGMMLGLDRTLGETVVVTLVIDNINLLADVSLFSPGNSITSALANEFTEAGQGLHTATLMELGLILSVITFIVLVASKLLLLRLQKNKGQKWTNTICLTL